MTAPADSRFDFSSASVLCLDANAMCLDLLTRILAGFGFRRIHRYTELEGARRAALTHAVDLLTIDPYHYGEDAYEFLRWFRTDRGGLNASVPVLIVTGHARMSLITDTLHCGADYVVAKPYSSSALLERILWVARHDTRALELIDAGDHVRPAGGGRELR